MKNLQDFPSEELSVDVVGLRIVGKQWGHGERRVLALHARFDNADSFGKLAPMFENARVYHLEGEASSSIAQRIQTHWKMTQADNFSARGMVG